MNKAPRIATCMLVSAGFALARDGHAADTPPPAPAPGVSDSYVGNQSISVGLTLHRFQDDFGLGAVVGSPTFAGDRLRVVLGGGFAFYPYAVNAQGEQDWVDYGHVRLLFEGGLRTPGSPIRLYGFGGPIVYVLPDRLAGNSAAIGGIGGFGFEYYFMMRGADHDGPVSYFIELGGVGTGAKADKMATKPSIGTGFSIAVGFHFYL